MAAPRPTRSARRSTKSAPPVRPAHRSKDIEVPNTSVSRVPRFTERTGSGSPLKNCGCTRRPLTGRLWSGCCSSPQAIPGDTLWSDGAASRVKKGMVSNKSATRRGPPDVKAPSRAPPSPVNGQGNSTPPGELPNQRGEFLRPRFPIPPDANLGVPRAESNPSPCPPFETTNNPKTSRTLVRPEERRDPGKSD